MRSGRGSFVSFRFFLVLVYQFCISRVCTPVSYLDSVFIYFRFSLDSALFLDHDFTLSYFFARQDASILVHSPQESCGRFRANVAEGT